MERLTKRDPKNNEPSYIYRTDCGDANVEATEYDAIWKLAACEDTGLAPEQITALQAENERLKARAEALERAIKECKVKDECDLKCHMCVNEGCEGYYDRDGDDRWIDGECDWCENRSKWQFDEARFTGGERE